MTNSPKVAFLVPCLNEEAAIGKLVRRCYEAIPGCLVFVYDNGSTDQTKEIATAAGAITRSEDRRGKGNVVRRMFADIDADIYILIDGDETYNPNDAPKMVDLILNNNVDLVTGKRVESFSAKEAYRQGHKFGNQLFTYALRRIFRSESEDVLSGYRVMSRRFVKTFPTTSRGFEIEVEMTAHASLLLVSTAEVPTAYAERPENSQSKLRTYRDGARIALALFRIFRSYSPSRFFGSLAFVSVASATPLFYTSLLEQYEGATTSLIVALMLLVLGFLLLSVGVILNAITRLRVEILRLAFLREEVPTWRSDWRS